MKSSRRNIQRQDIGNLDSVILINPVKIIGLTRNDRENLIISSAMKKKIYRKKDRKKPVHSINALAFKHTVFKWLTKQCSL